MKKVAILQSNYIPWKGYFDLLASVDEFIVFDDMQYTTRDWRNRNVIKTPQGLLWLTVPVGATVHRRIRDVELEPSWQAKHWKTLVTNYRRAPHFDAIAAWLEPLYLQVQHTHLTQLNRRFIEAVCGYLGIRTKLSYSWDYDVPEGKTERLVSLCRQAGGSEYVSGPAARDYVDAAQFQSAGIGLTWYDYSGYPEYPQLWGEFAHGVSVLDLLFNCGPESPNYMKLPRP